MVKDQQWLTRFPSMYYQPDEDLNTRLVFS